MVRLDAKANDRSRLPPKTRKQVPAFMTKTNQMINIVLEVKFPP
jgi:hypothetical protein